MSSYDRLRNLLNQSIAGPNTDALLYAMAEGDDLLDANSQAAVRNMFLKTAEGEFLDTLSSNGGVARPPVIGISDLALRNITRILLGYKNVTNAINDLLATYFSVFQVNGYTESENEENFVLTDGDTLTVQVDDSDAYEITFSDTYFRNIANATAIEVANFLNNTFLDQQIGAISVPYLNTVTGLNTVRIISKTRGPQGAISILGGTAQKALHFPAFIETTQDITTTFNITQPDNGIFRFTWSAGTDPDFDLVRVDDYVVVSGSEFEDANNGSFTVTQVVSGNVNHSYFEIYNTSGTTQSGVLLTNADHLLFFRPTDYTVLHRDQYAAAFEVSPGELDVIIPASTSIIERTPLTGGSYLSEEFFTFNCSVTTAFEVDETVVETTTRASGTVYSVSGLTLVLGNVQESFEDFPSTGTLFGENSSLSSAYTSVSHEIETDFTGAYLFDPDSYVMTCTSSTLGAAIIMNNNDIVIEVVSTTNFPSSGYVVIDFGTDTEESLVPYIAILNSTQIQIDPGYDFLESHSIGADVTVLKNNQKYVIQDEPYQRPAILTDVANARQNFVDNLALVKASGIFLNLDVLYPSNYGFSDFAVRRVWGSDLTLDTAGFLGVI